MAPDGTALIAWEDYDQRNRPFSEVWARILAADFWER
jgi:hypothetical protein